MSKARNGHWPTVILMNGRPYELKQLERLKVYNPCNVCDLRHFCNSVMGENDLIGLCESDGRDESWYFKENWEIYDKEIADFLDNQVKPK